MKILRNLWSMIVFYLWYKPTEKPERTPPLKIKAQEISHAYMVVTYKGQRISMLKDTEYPVWKAMGRKDKRAMAAKVAKQEREGKIRFEMIDGNWICVKGKDYDKIAKEAKEKHGN